LRAGIPPQALPLVWGQLQDQSRRMRPDALDDIAQVHERIDLQVIAGLHQRTQNGGAMGGGLDEDSRTQRFRNWVTNYISLGDPPIA
jgi:hypothetical protein